MRREEPRGGGCGGQAGVKAKHDIRVGRGAFQLDAGQKGRAVAGGDELQIAGAGRPRSAFSIAGPGPHSEVKLS